jgi:hypothetical protein
MAGVNDLIRRDPARCCYARPSLAGKVSRLRPEMLSRVSARGVGRSERLIDQRGGHDGIVPAIVVRGANRQPHDTTIVLLNEEGLNRGAGNVVDHRDCQQAPRDSVPDSNAGWCLIRNLRKTTINAGVGPLLVGDQRPIDDVRKFSGDLL